MVKRTIEAYSWGVGEYYSEDGFDGCLFTAADNWALTRGFAVFDTLMNKPH